MRFDASRPHMPGYGLLGPDDGRGLLPWSWAETRLGESRNSWLSTVSRVAPERVFGFIEDASEFAGAAARWRARGVGGPERREP